jgi:cytochrome b
MRGPWHEWLGYGAAAVVVFRVGWGLVGTGPARFASFVPGPDVTAIYLRAALKGRAPRYLGHNPLGGWMVVALLATAGLLCLSGWLFTTDWLWGYAWLSNTHRVLGWVLIGLVAMHLAGVAFTSWHQRENLVRAMVDGRKRAPAGKDVPLA